MRRRREKRRARLYHQAWIVGVKLYILLHVSMSYCDHFRELATNTADRCRGANPAGGGGPAAGPADAPPAETLALEAAALCWAKKVVLGHRNRLVLPPAETAVAGHHAEATVPSRETAPATVQSQSPATAVQGATRSNSLRYTTATAATHQEDRKDPTTT